MLYIWVQILDKVMVFIDHLEFTLEDSIPWTTNQLIQLLVN